MVLVSIESLSASFVGAYGSDQGLTPNLDRIAAEGVTFTRAFATGTRTVRGLEALSLGTPPVPGQSIVRRPRNAHLQTVGGILGIAWVGSQRARAEEAILLAAFGERYGEFMARTKRFVPGVY